MVSRAEHHRATLLKLSAATTETFEQLGSAATIDDIAARAGVSRRTVFRYVEGKEDLVFIHPVLWLEIFDDAISQVIEKPLLDRLMCASSILSAHIDADPEPVLRAMAVAAADPMLMRGYASVNRRWVDRIAAEVRGDSMDPDVIFRATVLGSAVMGVIDAAIAEWVVTEPRRPLGPIVQRGLDYLAPIF